MFIGGMMTALSAAVMKLAGDFDQAFANVNTVLDLTEGQMQQLKQVALEWSSAHVQSATEIANAYYEAASAGFTFEQTIGIIQPAAALATATFGDMTTSVKTIAQAMMVFGDSLKDYTTVQEKANAIANAFAFAVSSSLLKLPELSSGLSNVTAAAKQMGANMYDVVSALAMLRNAGLSAEKAGTALNSMFIKLPELTKQFSINVFDAAGNVRPLVDILEDLQKAVGGTIDTFDEFEAIQNAFTYRGQRAISILLSNIKQFKALRTEIEFFSDVYAMAAEREAGFVSQTKILVNNIQNLAISFGSSLLPAVEGAMSALKTLANIIESIPKPIQAIIGATTALSGGFIFLVGSISVLVSTLLKLKAGLKAIWLVLSSPLMLAITALVSGFVMLGYAITKNIEEQKKIKQAIKEVAYTAKAANTAIKKFDEALETDNVDRMLLSIKKLASIFPSVEINFQKLSEAQENNIQYLIDLIEKYKELNDILLKLSGIDTKQELVNDNELEKIKTVNLLYQAITNKIVEYLKALSESDAKSTFTQQIQNVKKLRTNIDAIRNEYLKLKDDAGITGQVITDSVIENARSIEELFDGLSDVLPEKVKQYVEESKKHLQDLVINIGEGNKELAAQSFMMWENSMNKVMQYTNEVERAIRIAQNTAKGLKKSGFDEYSAEVLSTNQNIIDYYQSLSAVEELTGILYTKNQAIVEQYNITQTAIKGLVEAMNEYTISSDAAQAAIDYLTKKLEELRDQYLKAKYEMQKEKLSATLQEDQIMFADYIENIKSSLEGLSGELKLNVLEKIITKLKKYMDDLSEAFALGAIDMNEYRQKMLELSNEIDRLNSVYDKIKSELNETTKAMNETSSATEKATEATNEFTDAMTSLISKYRDITTGTRATRDLANIFGLDKLGQLEEEYSSLKSYITDVYVEYLKFGKMSIDVAETYKKSVARLKELNAQIEELKKTREVQQYIEKLKTSMEETFDSEVVNNKIIELKESFGLLTDDLSKLKEEMNVYTNELNKLIDTYANLLVAGEDLSDEEKDRLNMIAKHIEELSRQISTIEEAKKTEEELNSFIQAGRDLLKEYNYNIEKYNALAGVTISYEEAHNKILQAMINTYEQIIDRKIKYGKITQEEQKWIEDNIETIKEMLSEDIITPEEFAAGLNKTLLDIFADVAIRSGSTFTDEFINELEKAFANGKLSDILINSLDFQQRKQFLENKINEFKNEIIKLLQEQPIDMDIKLNVLLPKLRESLTEYSNLINEIQQSQFFEDILSKITNLNKLYSNNLITTKEYYDSLDNLYNDSLKKASELGIELNNVGNYFKSIGVDANEITKKLESIKITDFYKDISDQLKLINKLYTENAISEEDRANRIKRLYKSALESGIKLGLASKEIISQLSNLSNTYESIINQIDVTSQIDEIEKQFDNLQQSINSKFSKLQFIDQSSVREQISGLLNELNKLKEIAETSNIVDREKIINDIDAIEQKIQEFNSNVEEFNYNILDSMMNTSETISEEIQNILNEISNAYSDALNDIENANLEGLLSTLDKLTNYFNELQQLSANINLIPLERFIDSAKIKASKILIERINQLIDLNVTKLNDAKNISEQISNIEKTILLLKEKKIDLNISDFQALRMTIELEKKREELLKRQLTINIGQNIQSSISSALEEAAKNKYNAKQIKLLFYSKVKESIISAMVEAFMQTEKMKKLMKALSEIIRKGVLDGFDNETIQNIIEVLDKIAEHFSNSLQKAISKATDKLDEKLSKAPQKTAAEGETYYYQELPLSKDAYNAWVASGWKPPFETQNSSVIKKETTTTKTTNGIKEIADEFIRKLKDGLGSTNIILELKLKMQEDFIRKAFESQLAIIYKEYFNKYAKLLMKAINDGIKEGKTVVDAYGELVGKYKEEYEEIQKEQLAALGELFDRFGPLFDRLQTIKRTFEGLLSGIKNALQTYVSDLKQGIDKKVALDKLYTNIKNAVYNSVIDGLIQAFLASKVLQPYIEVLSNLIADALMDGVVTAEEKAKIKEAGEKLAELIKPFAEVLSELIESFGMVTQNGTGSTTTAAANPFDLVGKAPSINTTQQQSTKNIIINLNENSITIQGDNKEIDQETIITEVQERLYEMALAVSKRVGEY